MTQPDPAPFAWQELKSSVADDLPNAAVLIELAAVISKMREQAIQVHNGLQQARTQLPKVWAGATGEALGRLLDDHVRLFASLAQYFTPQFPDDVPMDPVKLVDTAGNGIIPLNHFINFEADNAHITLPLIGTNVPMWDALVPGRLLEAVKPAAKSQDDAYTSAADSLTNLSSALEMFFN